MPPSRTSLWSRLRQRRQFILVAGPCVIEGEALCLRIAESIARTAERLGLLYVFKASYDKANRSSAQSCRGPGLEAGLRTFARIRSQLGLPTLTDVHTEAEVTAAAGVVDVLQIPAFLCRQTDLIQAAARTGRIVNLKKGQFLAPEDMRGVVEKVTATGHHQILLTERGSTFGYHNLVVDFRAIPLLQQLGYPVLLDATHSVQRPGALGHCSGGDREFAPVLARAAIAAGADGLFIETHPHPERALSDGPNMIPLRQLPKLLETCLRLQEALA